MLPKKDLRTICPTVCRILGLRIPRTAETMHLPDVTESMDGLERLAVVVVDAFGVSTWAKAWDKTPFFNTLSGHHHKHLASMMPSITPVNFATMLTGASPEEHKVEDRTQDLKLETILDVLSESGGISATAARAESSLGILISPNSDRPGKAYSNTDQEVTEIAVNHINACVDLLWVQLLDVDEIGHRHGPTSSESMKACMRADKNLRQIAEAALNEGYGLLALADHGQHEYLRDDGTTGGTHGTAMEEDRVVPLVWASNNELGHIDLINS
ncbi:MAG: alkaline phosphatase family protein [Candidatus Bathyarchaeia archaeon]